MPVPQGDITTTQIMNQVVVEPEEKSDDLPAVQDSGDAEQPVGTEESK